MNCAVCAAEAAGRGHSVADATRGEGAATRMETEGFPRVKSKTQRDSDLTRRGC